ncbi:MULTISPECIES: DUF429 domain-containing protein [Alicyclobacillus]|uniref:DUF429 domain-containing protein n=1 Tax=Alicyclobacillus acidoterrestris (strain ATCC 49025 / DSM 3922 / CIP 106132 / NCIMB 13137 / GD3B) TaxID=1356854 RepID=T0CK99_ALIAG|nr:MULTISPECIES: DUF429 domain-containing protein [Alicyclobacillus]EPZ52930.1 hypothetical protein N007_02170 [Alicyclobacillus acidoterrestris ATCC 49025]UNO49140.1 DUF429 domain-containing protein [Alicyclobacillus acidoterrestris]
MYFIGVDLAFSSRNDTGVVVLEGALESDFTGLRYIGAGLFKQDDEIADFILPYLRTGECLLAIDAPLIVNNDFGMRTCERLVAKAFGHRNCAAYPSNRNNMAGTRGPQFIRYLLTQGVPIKLDIPTLPMRCGAVHAFETYPHAGHLALFDLPTVWKYKKKSGRSWDLCRSEMVNYWRKLWDLMPSVMDGILACAHMGDPLGAHLVDWLSVIRAAGPLPEVRGVRYKAFEDLTDALFCAYSAAHIAMGAPRLLFCGANQDAPCDGHAEMVQDYILVPASSARSHQSSQ